MFNDIYLLRFQQSGGKLVYNCDDVFVSVIVIGYNVEDYISSCMRSCLDINYQNYELIFVDDGSTDKTLGKVKELNKGNKIKIIHKSNGGIVSARQEGVRSACGAYILFVDGDDWVNSEILTSLTAPLKKCKNFDIVCSNYFEEQKSGDFFVVDCTATEDTLSELEYFKGIMTDAIDHHMFPKLYRKELLVKSGYLNYPHVTMAEDLMTNAFLGIYRPKVYFVNEANYYYRYSDTSIIRHGKEKLLEQLTTLKYMWDYIVKKNIIKEAEVYLIYQYLSYFCAYIDSDIDYNIKQIITQEVKHKCREYGGYANYYREYYRKEGKSKKIFMTVFWKMPIFARPLNELLLQIKCLYIKCKSIKRIKDTLYRQKMISYYHGLTQNLKKYQKEKVVLIGTSDRSNIGDHTIALSEKIWLKRWFPERDYIEITGDHYRYEKLEIKKIVSANDIIFITGGGFLGDLWMDEENMVRSILKTFPDNKIIILSQTIHFYNFYDEKSVFKDSYYAYNRHNNLSIIAREENSFILLKKFFPDIRSALFPDFALMYKPKIDRCHVQNKILLCLRKDKERVISIEFKNNIINFAKSIGMHVDEVSTLAVGRHGGDIKISHREDKIKEKLEEFSTGKLMITDRLHGMILATIIGVPCIALDNASHKVSGVYNAWMKSIPYVTLLEASQDIFTVMKDMLALDKQEYDIDYLMNDIDDMYKYINEV